MKKLAIITTHPIQYYAPIFRLLQQRNNISIKVFYTLGETIAPKHDPGFGKNISWDIPLLDGYDFEWLVNISPAPGSHYFKGIVTPGAIEQIKKYQPDALLVFGWAYKSHLKIIQYFKGKKPVYFRGDSTLLDKLGVVKSTARQIFLRWVYANISHVFYVGTNNRAYYLKHGLNENQMTFAPHAIDNERFSQNHSENAVSFRAGLGLNNDDILVLFAGKIEAKKAPLILLQAFVNLNKSGVHLLYVGNGPLEIDLKAKSKNVSRVHYIDFQNQSQMPAIYQACDLFCLPSSGPNESWGLAVNEAMAAGKAILASDKIGCATDLVKSMQNGAVFRAGDAADLSEKLGLLTMNKKRLAKFGAASKLIIKDWSFEQIALAIENKLLNEAT